MSIQTECMTINLTIGMWMGYRLDRVKSKQVTTAAGADDDAARVNKHLVPKESLAKVGSAFTTVRNHFHKNTLPWKDSGDRLITRKRYAPFMVEHVALRDAAMVEVEDFLTRTYLTARDQAEFRMGDMFDPHDYPSPDVLRRKFYILFDIDGISTAYDFRLSNQEAVMQARVTKAMSGLYEKLAKPLQQFTEQMGDANRKIFDSTVNNLRAIVEMLPELNFTGDEELAALGERIGKALTIHEAADLRKFPDNRKAVAGEAAEILESMRGFMNAFGKQEELEDA